MNLIHRRLCGSPGWARYVKTSLLPWVLQGTDLGPDLLELGPGLGVTTALLRDRTTRLTALEIDPRFIAGLRERFGESVQIVRGDAAAMPFPDGAFTGAACFTMLHHVPTPAGQDRLFAEVHRVLAPGGVFAGCDSRPNLRLRVIHLRDTLVPVDPATLPARLTSAGFCDVRVDTTDRRLRFAARKPAARAMS